MRKLNFTAEWKPKIQTINGKPVTVRYSLELSREGKEETETMATVKRDDKTGYWHVDYNKNNDALNFNGKLNNVINGVEEYLFGNIVN